MAADSFDAFAELRTYHPDMIGKTNLPARQNETRHAERAFIWCFFACSVFLPLLFGELFPFSSAPMFRDRPSVYCEYQVTDPKGVQLALRDFQLQRNYDGNPTGMGAGLIPAPSLDRFGTAPSLEAVRIQIAERLRSADPTLAYVDVRQRIIGAIDEDRVGVIRDETIRVRRHAQ